MKNSMIYSRTLDVALVPFKTGLAYIWYGTIHRNGRIYECGVFGRAMFILKYPN